LNIFTAPVYVCAFLSLLVAIVVVFFYDGRIQGEDEKTENVTQEGVTTIESFAKNSVESSSLECLKISTVEKQQQSQQQIKPDWISIGCCFLTRFCIATYDLYLFK
jgi:Tfp pilus assembly protein PilO